MKTNRDLIAKWSIEYAKGGIPSSVREMPSGAVTWAVERLRQDNYPLRTALDAGCGKGRNSLYLAQEGMEVTSLDFTHVAIEHLQNRAIELGLSGQIRPLVHDVTEDWPVAPASMDLIIDTFCFKHIAAHGARDAYRANLLRSLRVRGHYLISFAGIGDGFYGQYIVDTINDEEQVATDPVNGVESVLYTRDAIVKYFAPELVPFDELQNNKPSVMHGKEYERSAYALLFQRAPHRSVL